MVVGRCLCYGAVGTLKAIISTGVAAIRNTWCELVLFFTSLRLYRSALLTETYFLKFERLVASSVNTLSWLRLLFKFGRLGCFSLVSSDLYCSGDCFNGRYIKSCN